MMKTAFFLAGLLMFLSCNEKDDFMSVKGEREGYIPIYADTFRDLRDTVRSLPPRKILNPVKAYTYYQWLFIHESDSGIHVFNNSNPAFPQAACYITIPGLRTISCKDSLLFAESRFGLIQIDITNLPAITGITFLSPYFAKYAMGDYYIPPFNENDFYPEGANVGLSRNSRKVFYECIDPTKGYVIGWKTGKINDPKCHR